MAQNSSLHQVVTRRQLLGAAGVGTFALSGRSWALTSIDLPLPDGPESRPLTSAFPQKGSMILQRTRPPLLETPFDVFDKGVFTPQRSVLCALALGSDPDRYRSWQVQPERTRPCDSIFVAINEGHPAWIAACRMASNCQVNGFPLRLVVPNPSYRFTCRRDGDHYDRGTTQNTDRRSGTAVRKTLLLPRGLDGHTHNCH